MRAAPRSACARRAGRSANAPRHAQSTRSRSCQRTMSTTMTMTAISVSTDARRALSAAFLLRSTPTREDEMAISLETRGSSRVRNIVFEDPDWQMTYGERLALDGVVSSLRPRLALEIGSAEGGSLACTAEHSEEVHSFDLVSVTDPGAYPNVT